MRYERHDLLHLSRTGRERIAWELAAKGFDRQAVAGMLLPEGASPIPGIVRREEFAPREGRIPVGFVSWRADARGRLRLGAFALPEDVETMVSPEDVMEKFTTLGREKARRTTALAALAALNAPLRSLPLALGVWGSAAMEIETGYPYTHSFSDLDIRLKPKGPVSRDALRACLDVVAETERTVNIRIDAELHTVDAYGVSLKELLGGGATVLGKGLQDVALLLKTDVFAGLAKQNPD